MPQYVPVNISDCLKHVHSHTDHKHIRQSHKFTTDSPAVQPTNQEACHLTKHPLHLSLSLFSEDDYCLCLWRWIEQATSKHTSPSLSLLCKVMAVFGDTIWWWKVCVQLRALRKSCCHIYRTESRITQCEGSSNCDRYMHAGSQFKSKKRGKNVWISMIKCELWPLESKTCTSQCLIHGSTQRISAGIIVAESWSCLCLCVAHGKKKKKNTRDITQCVLHGAGHCCHGDSVTHGSLIWI